MRTTWSGVGIPLSKALKWVVVFLYFDFFFFRYYDDCNNVEYYGGMNMDYG